MATIIFVNLNTLTDVNIDRCKIPIALSKYGVLHLITNVMQLNIGTFAVESTAHRNTNQFRRISAVPQGSKKSGRIANSRGQ